jgi:hypothetical protein
MPHYKSLTDIIVRSARIKLTDDGLSGVMTGFAEDGVPLSLTIPRAILERLRDQIPRELVRVPKPSRGATGRRVLGLS